MPPQLGDISLAETHHFHVGLALGVEVRTALGTAHGECCERVLKRLLKCEELKYRLVDRRVEPYTTLVRANGIVVLHTISHVILYATLVVNPCHPERENPVGDTQTFDKVISFKLGMFVIYVFNCGYYLLHCLEILRLIWKAPFQII